MSAQETTVKRMTKKRCEALWNVLASVHCVTCENEYGKGHLFASVCVGLPGCEDTDMIPTQDLYLVSLSCLVKTNLVNRRRYKKLTDMDKDHVFPFMSASWKYDGDRVYALHGKGIKHKDYGLTVVKHFQQPGEIQRVLVTSICQCLCALRKAALEKRLYGPFDSFDMGLTDNSVMTAVDEPPMNPTVYFEQEEERICHQEFIKKRREGNEPAKKPKKILVAQQAAAAVAARDQLEEFKNVRNLRLGYDKENRPSRSPTPYTPGRSGRSRSQTPDYTSPAKPARIKVPTPSKTQHQKNWLSSPSPSRRNRQLSDSAKKSLALRSLSAMRHNLEKGVERERTSHTSNESPVQVSRSASRVQKPSRARDEGSGESDDEFPDEPTVDSLRDRAELFANNKQYDRFSDEENELEDDDAVENFHILQVADKLKSTGRSASNEFDSDMHFLKHDAGRSIQKLELDCKVLAEMGKELVTCHERTFKQCDNLKGHSELVKNIRHTSGKFSEFLSTTVNFIQTLKMEAVGGIRYGIYNAWIAAGASRALLGVRALTELPTYKTFANAELAGFPSFSSPKFLTALMSTMTYAIGDHTNQNTSAGSYNNLVEATNQISLTTALEKTLWPEGIMIKASGYDGPHGRYLPESSKVLREDANPSQLPFATKRHVFIPSEQTKVTLVAVGKRIWVMEDRFLKMHHAFLNIAFGQGKTRTALYNQFFKFNSFFMQTFMFKNEWIWNSWGKTPNPIYAVHTKLYMDILEEFGRIFNYNLPVGKKIDYATEFKYGLSKLHKMMSDKRRLALAEGEAELRYPTMDLCFLNVVQHTDKQKRAKGSYSRFFWEPSELPENNSQLAAAVKQQKTTTPVGVRRKLQPAAGSLRRNGGSEDAGCSTSAENDSVRKEIMDVDGSDDDQNEGVGLNATLSSPRKTQRKRKLKLSGQREKKDDVEQSGTAESKRRKIASAGSSNKLHRSRRRLESDFSTSLPLPKDSDILLSPPREPSSNSAKMQKPSSHIKRKTVKEISEDLSYNGCDVDHPRFEEMVSGIRSGKTTVAKAVKVLVG